jgi:hypothetical protein
MQLFLVVPGLISLMLNSWMFAIGAANPKIRKMETFYCYVMGILWGFTSPVLSAAYFTDVACASGCNSMDCVGEGLACFVSKSSPFFVQVSPPAFKYRLCCQLLVIFSYLLLQSLYLSVLILLTAIILTEYVLL